MRVALFHRRRRVVFIAFAGCCVVAALVWKASTIWNLNPLHRVGDEIDRLNGVPIYFNGAVGHCGERNVTPDGYNLGLPFQCVEFVKRYYFEHLHHRMPDSYGHAKDFFDASLPDGTYNPKRDLVQYTNGSRTRPEPDDLIILGPSATNQYGHVAIVSAVENTSVEIAQQNPGPFGPSRARLAIRLERGVWKYDNARVLGWLRKETPVPATEEKGATRRRGDYRPLLS